MARVLLVAYVTVRSLAQFSASPALGFFPRDAKYSSWLDKVVIASDTPNSLRLVDPFTGVVASLLLPDSATSLQLSRDGKLAVVMHPSSFSLVDLEALAIVRTTASDGTRSDAFVANDGTVYLIGAPGGTFSEIAVFDGRTGAQLVQPSLGGSGFFYGTQHGILAGGLNKAFLIEEGLSPTDIQFFTIDPTTKLADRAGDSPYHGDYPMGTPMYLSDDEGLIFTVDGTYFRTDSLQYAGVLAGIDRSILGFSHRAATQEALALAGQPSTANDYPFPPDLPAAYKRYTGSLLQADADLQLPTINGAQSYGRKIFHSSNGAHVVLVQTGTTKSDGVGASFFVIVR